MQETSPISISSQGLHSCFTQLAQSGSDGSESKGSARCSHLTRTGRPCQLPIMDATSGLCFRHAGLRTPKKDPEDFSADLLNELTEFHTPYEVNEFLARLLFLLVRNRISAKRAGILTYIAAQLLHSLTEVRRVEKDEPVQIILDGPRPNRDEVREPS